MRKSFQWSIDTFLLPHGGDKWLCDTVVNVSLHPNSCRDPNILFIKHVHKLNYTMKQATKKKKREKKVIKISSVFKKNLHEVQSAEMIHFYFFFLIICLSHYILDTILDDAFTDSQHCSHWTLSPWQLFGFVNCWWKRKQRCF